MHRIVTKAEELEQMPDGAVILDTHERAHQFSAEFDWNFWHEAGDGTPSRSEDIWLPARVIWEPR